MFEDSSLLGLRIQLYAFFGYLLNDLPMSWENSLIRLHHLVCNQGRVSIANSLSGRRDPDHAFYYPPSLHLPEASRGFWLRSMLQKHMFLLLWAYSLWNMAVCSTMPGSLMRRLALRMGKAV